MTAEDDTAFLWRTLSWKNPQQAIDILNHLMEVLPEVMLEVMDIGSVSVIDTARQAQGDVYKRQGRWSTGPRQQTILFCGRRMSLIT